MLRKCTLSSAVPWTSKRCPFRLAAFTTAEHKMFELLGFTPERAQQQFGWLLDAFKYGAPPHGGLAYGLDRWVSLFAGLDSIRDCIAFPKNNSGRDTMIDAPSVLEPEQLTELNILVNINEK